MKSRVVGCATRNAAVAAKQDISRKCADNVRNLSGKRVRKAAVLKGSGKCAKNVRRLKGKGVRRVALEKTTAEAVRTAINDTCCCCGQAGHRRPECRHRNEKCSLHKK